MVSSWPKIITTLLSISWIRSNKVVVHSAGIVATALKAEFIMIFNQLAHHLERGCGSWIYWHGSRSSNFVQGSLQRTIECYSLQSLTGFPSSVVLLQTVNQRGLSRTPIQQCASKVRSNQASCLQRLFISYKSSISKNHRTDKAKSTHHSKARCSCTRLELR